MFIRMLRDVECKYHYWFNQEAFNPRSEEDHYRRNLRSESLKEGKVFPAIKVNENKPQAGLCEIITDDGEHDCYYSRVPLDSFERLAEDPSKPK